MLHAGWSAWASHPAQSFDLDWLQLCRVLYRAGAKSDWSDATSEQKPLLQHAMHALLPIDRLRHMKIHGQ